MSYCRWGQEDSSVYVYPAQYGDRAVIICQSCKLIDEYGNAVVESPAEMVAHLEAHRLAGHVVPQFAIDRLKDEIMRKQ